MNRAVVDLAFKQPGQVACAAFQNFGHHVQRHRLVIMLMNISQGLFHQIRTQRLNLLLMHLQQRLMCKLIKNALYHELSKIMLPAPFLA
ncbi:hypothetical protein D3C78_1121350 [compost metagenome]